MHKIFRIKALGLAISMVCLIAAAAFAASATGAYFSDTKSGAVTGTGAKVTVGAGVNADTGGGLNISWANMLPGEVYSATANYANSGDVPQDIWVVFPNKTALSALNSLGAYGAAQILDSSAGSVFYSNNLLDHPHDTQGAPGFDGRGPIRMLPQMIKLRSGLPVGVSGAMTFKFQYASKIGNGSTGSNFSFNVYPAPFTGGSTQDLAKMAGGAQSDQVTIIASDGTGAGLPFAIVATQVGVEPNAVGSFAGF